MTQIEDRVFTALADTTRRQLLTRLAQSGPQTATQIARDFPISRQGIMKQLDLLSHAGLVQTHRSGRERQYMFNPQSLQEAARWIETIGKQWDERLQRLKDFIENDSDTEDADHHQ